jgi:NAD(P)H-dependent flavin oxidoreductase YrpB (nitropropane dioxygenase family)
MQIKTWLTERLGIRYPIIQGAFHKFGTSALAGPVSAAGGLGIITAHCFDTPEKLIEDIRKVRTMTPNPVGVNFTIIPGKLGSCEDYASRMIDTPLIAAGGIGDGRGHDRHDPHRC